MSHARPVTIFIAEDNPILLQGLDRALSASGYAVETAPKLTADLAIAGTPLYMAPESIAGAVNASPASDLYALGAVAFFLLTANLMNVGGITTRLVRLSRTWSATSRAASRR